MKKILFMAFAILFAASAFAQIEKPVTWSYAAKKTSATQAVVFIKATINKGWHVYSQHLKDGGPQATVFTFKPTKGYSLVGKTIEPKPISKYEDAFKMNVGYFENSVIFQQKIKIKPGTPVVVKGTLTYMTCNDRKCLPPDDVEFSIPVK